MTKPETFGQRFGELVKARRLARGWGQGRLADEAWGKDDPNFIGKDRAAQIVRIEKGTAANPQPETVFALQTALGISSAEIAELRGEQPAGDPEFVAALLERNAGLAKELHLKDRLVIGLARGVASDVADFDTALREMGRALKLAAQMRDQAALPSNTGDQVAEVLRRLSALNDDNRLDEGADLIAAELARLDAQKARLYDAAIDQDILRRNAPSAARWLVERLKAENPPNLFAALGALQDDWYARGRDGGLNFEAEVAIHLAHASRAHATTPDQRGTALNNLGNALATLGERAPGTARLEEAATVYRAALEEFTRDRATLGWARAQMNLGNALLAHGQREPGTARLEEAVAAYRAALEELTRNRVPLDWAMTQMNLGNALLALGQREPETARLEQAVAAYHAALEERTRDRFPLDWAMTQMNLGNALLALGQREPATVRLEEAVTAYRAALKERPRDRVPLDWATSQMNFGLALLALGQRGTGTMHLAQALAAFNSALQERTRERVPLDWALARGHQGTAMLVLAERTGDVDMTKAALHQLREAEAILRLGGHAVNADAMKHIASIAEARAARLTGYAERSP